MFTTLEMRCELLRLLLSGSTLPFLKFILIKIQAAQIFFERRPLKNIVYLFIVDIFFHKKNKVIKKVFIYFCRDFNIRSNTKRKLPHIPEAAKVVVAENE